MSSSLKTFEMKLKRKNLGFLLETFGIKTLIVKSRLDAISQIKKIKEAVTG
jgi:hypothetical protein